MVARMSPTEITSPLANRPRRVAPSPTDPSTRHLPGGRLTLEWTRLRTRPDALLQAAGWGIVDGHIDDLDQVLAAVGYEVVPTPNVEVALRRLVDTAATDELAARVVIQRLLPGLLAIVGKRRRQGLGDGAVEELLGAAWIAVRTFNPERRPACLAAALLADADYRAFRADLRRRSSTEEPVDLTTRPIASIDEPSPADELDELFELARESGVPDADLGLLRQLLDAPRAIDLARQLQVTPRTLRNRRDRITDRLREVALAA